MASSYSAFLAMLWQQFDQLMSSYHQDPITDAELAHLASMPDLDSEAFYQQYGLSSGDQLHRLTKAMISEVVAYRLAHNPYYVCPKGFDHLKATHRRTVQLGWGL